MHVKPKHRYLGIIWPLSYLILVFSWPHPLLAQNTEENAKQWGNLSLRGPFLKTNPKLIYLIDAQTRYHFDPNTLETGLLRAGLGWKLKSNLSTWFGYQWSSHNLLTGTKQTNLIWHQLLWQALKKERITLTNQSRIEARARQEQAQWNIRLRQLDVIEFPNTFSKKFHPAFWNEIFVNFNKPAWVTQNTIDQNRAFAGINIWISSNSFLYLGYMNQYEFRKTNNQSNNIFLVSYFLNTKNI